MFFPRMKQSLSQMFAALAALSGLAFAQNPPLPPAAAPPGDVIGVSPYMHLVTDLNKSLDFYQNILGTTPVGNPTRVFGPNPMVAKMYNATGALIRTATLKVPGSDLTVELVDWSGLQRPKLDARIYDPGAAALILFVRDVEAAMHAVTAHGGSISTPGGKPVQSGKNRFIMARDPDGFFIELLQFDPLPSSASTTAATGNILTGRFRLTAMDSDRTARFYREAFGFHLPAAGKFADDATLGAITGLGVAKSRMLSGVVPGTALSFEVVEFQGTDGKRLHQNVHGIGTSMLRLQVHDIDAVLAQAKTAGAAPVTEGGQPITLDNGRRMIVVEDPNGLLVQIWQAAPK